MNVKQITIEDDNVYGLSSALHTIRTKVLPVTPYYDMLGEDVCNWLHSRYVKYQQKFNYNN